MEILQCVEYLWVTVVVGLEPENSGTIEPMRSRGVRFEDTGTEAESLFTITEREMAELTDALKAEKLEKFTRETKADGNVANYYLQSTNWDLETAISGFKELKLAEERRIESRAANTNKESRPATTGNRRSKQHVGPLRRGISMANTELVANAREKMMVSDISNRLDTSFILPNITIVKEPDLVHFLKNDLIDKATYQSLTNTGVLNWWAGSNVSACRKLFPMSTVGDGNCLLHAVTLAMCGFQDRLLTLRKALHKSLTNESANGALKRRWMYQQWKLNMEAGGLSFTHQEWEDEWAGLVRLASDTPRNHHKASSSPTRKISKQYSIAITNYHDDSLKRTDSLRSDSFESLEEFHVFALAHVLRRPIVVVSDAMLRDLSGQPLQPIHFGGIYLPIECDPSTCYKYPVVLGYDSGHFAALVPAEGEDVATNKKTLLSNVPITRPSFELLPLHFITDPGVGWTLTEQDSKKKKLPELSKQEKLLTLSQYLHITKVDHSNKTVPMIPTFQTNDVTEYELDASDLGSFYRKKSKEGKPFVAKAFENLTTLVTGHLNPNRAPLRSQTKNSGPTMYTAKLDMVNKPDYFDEMIENYIASARKKLQEGKSDSDRNELKESENDKEQQKSLNQMEKCATSGCTFFGSPETNYLCSKCFKYQSDMSRVHKSMPSLLDDRPTLLKVAKRQLSNPGKVECDDPLIDFDDSSKSIPLRPETAPPPQRNQMGEDPYASSESFDSMLERVLFSYNSHSKPTATCRPVGQELRKDSPSPIPPTKTVEPNSRSIIKDNLAEFDPLKSGFTRSDEKPVAIDRRVCKGSGCKIFGDAELDGFCYSCFTRLTSNSQAQASW